MNNQNNILSYYALSYDDILLEPKYSDIESREQVDLSTKFCDGVTLNIPLITAPMDTITEDEMANTVSDMGGMGVIHRYNTIERQVEIAQKVKHGCLLAAAIGASGDFLERAKALNDGANCHIFCIDVAHGHHVLVKKAIESIRNTFGDSVCLITGNVATSKAFLDLSEWGSDLIRCSVGSGAACTTRVNTGHGVPGLTTIMNCAFVKKMRNLRTKIIADGGIRNAGDATKALALGADFVMVGALVSGTDECPMKPVMTPTGLRVPYRGLASREAQMDWRGTSTSPEGISTTVAYRGSVVNVLRDFVGNLKSGLSYSGARNLTELREKATYIVQTSAGFAESNPHILTRNS